MRTGWWIPITFLGLAFAVVAGQLVGGQFSKSSPATAQQTASTGTTDTPLFPLFVPDDKLNAGDVWESQKAVISLPIHNNSDQDIEITRFEKSCNCASLCRPVGPLRSLSKLTSPSAPAEKWVTPAARLQSMFAPSVRRAVGKWCGSFAARRSAGRR
jgi:hypothetical protein